MTNSPKGFTLNNADSCRVKFARRFLRSLIEIKTRQTNYNNNLSSSPSSSSEIRRRSERIKLKAYSSMAHAVGPRKAWTRALLLKLHNRAKRHRFRTRKRSSLAMVLKKKRVFRVKNHANFYKPAAERGNYSVLNSDEKTEKLRELVPGGKAMDICSLLEETAHFIKCLAMQVQVMHEIADQLSN
ncbi:hypothetical protein L484_012015 [Morus notabilis]|uniref:IBH1-like N-terminal domain-containing protein n=1 Tax=Morus notabilis TaxID=981085 RepID=W9R2H9_9ROSA|nr:transcription factor IBH1 [Morus notabilis]XP_010103930.1 transcription factor IBH1 [Morus notabilis]EXB52661.1 hypothetical protein L484_022438 [Morus notabilis]EXB97447.1 hypothetical protein L484_012015 [Morus notabilis]